MQAKVSTLHLQFPLLTHSHWKWVLFIFQTASSISDKIKYKKQLGQAFIFDVLQRNTVESCSLTSCILYSLYSLATNCKQLTGFCSYFSFKSISVNSILTKTMGLHKIGLELDLFLSYIFCSTTVGQAGKYKVFEFLSLQTFKSVTLYTLFDNTCFHLISLEKNFINKIIIYI